MENGQTLNGINCVSEYTENKSLETVNVRKTKGQKHMVCFEINPVLWYLLHGEMFHSGVLKNYKVLFQVAISCNVTFGNGWELNHDAGCLRQIKVSLSWINARSGTICFCMENIHVPQLEESKSLGIDGNFCSWYLDLISCLTSFTDFVFWITEVSSESQLDSVFCSSNWKCCHQTEKVVETTKWNHYEVLDSTVGMGT